MISKDEILRAYSRGEIGWMRTVSLMELGGYRDLLVLMVGVGLPLPRPPQDQIDQQVQAALPLLRAALIPHGNPKGSRPDTAIVTRDGNGDMSLGNSKGSRS